VRRAREQTPFDHPVDEEHVVPFRIRDVALDRGVVEHRDVLVVADVATDSLRGDLFLEPPPPGVELPRVRTQIRA
jgi:hypothetical protein